MKKVLIEWCTNWADEMDIEGWTIVDKEKSKEIISYVTSTNSDFSISVGTNEEIDYSNGKEFLDDLTFTDITDEEANTLIKLFGESYGHYQFVQYFMDEDDDDYTDFDGD